MCIFALTLKKKSAPGFKFKVSKDRLLGGNTCGDMKLKLLVVSQSENPRALKQCVIGQCCGVSVVKECIANVLMHDIFNCFSQCVWNRTAGIITWQTKHF